MTLKEKEGKVKLTEWHRILFGLAAETRGSVGLDARLERPPVSLSSDKFRTIYILINPMASRIGKALFYSSLYREVAGSDVLAVLAGRTGRRFGPTLGILGVARSVEA